MFGKNVIGSDGTCPKVSDPERGGEAIGSEMTSFFSSVSTLDEYWERRSGLYAWITILVDSFDVRVLYIEPFLIKLKSKI